LLLYYITDRRQLPGNPAQQRTALLEKIASAARAGVDFIQLREKDLDSRQLEGVARDAADAIAAAPEGGTRLLVNSRVDVAIAAACHGVHLPAGDLDVQTAREIFHAASYEGLVAASCHSAEEVRHAAMEGADFAVAGPVFEKASAAGVPAIGIAGLSAATRAASVSRPGFPVLALGGVTAQNAGSCLAAGASGIAAIRLFQENDVAALVGRLRSLADKQGGAV
jgi:thiamine-phosphate pyrophosphorylase